MNDQRLEQIVGTLLRAGVVIAAAIVLAGGIWYLVTSGGGTADFHRFRPSVTHVRALGQLPRPEALILAGLLVLIATPIARVVFSLIAFAAEHDRTYVICTGVVLIVLLYSLGTAWL